MLPKAARVWSKGLHARIRDIFERDVLGARVEQPDIVWRIRDQRAGVETPVAVAAGAQLALIELIVVNLGLTEEEAGGERSHQHVGRRVRRLESPVRDARLAATLWGHPRRTGVCVPIPEAPITSIE